LIFAAPLRGEGEFVANAMPSTMGKHITGFALTPVNEVKSISVYYQKRTANNMHGIKP